MKAGHVSLALLPSVTSLHTVITMLLAMFAQCCCEEMREIFTFSYEFFLCLKAYRYCCWIILVISDCHSNKVLMCSRLIKPFIWTYYKLSIQS
jgi:hypothetical protein